jgi:hypothetical protein
MSAQRTVVDNREPLVSCERLVRDLGHRTRLTLLGQFVKTRLHEQARDYLVDLGRDGTADSD